MQHADGYETTWVAPPAEEVYVEITTQSVVIDILYGVDLPGIRITPDASRSCWVIDREGIVPGEYVPWRTVPSRKEEARRLDYEIYCRNTERWDRLSYDDWCTKQGQPTASQGV